PPNCGTASRTSKSFSSRVIPRTPFPNTACWTKGCNSWRSPSAASPWPGNCGRSSARRGAKKLDQRPSARIRAEQFPAESVELVRKAGVRQEHERALAFDHTDAARPAEFHRAAAHRSGAHRTVHPNRPYLSVGALRSEERRVGKEGRSR